MATSKNFGAPSRSMAKAARHFLEIDRKQGGSSHNTVAAHTSRVGNFEKFARAEGVKGLEQVTPELVERYGRALVLQVEAGQIGIDHAKNCVSSVNTTMTLAARSVGAGWICVAPKKDCDMPNRDQVRTVVPGGIDRDGLDLAIAAAGLDPVQKCLVEMARDFGLRAKESGLIEPRQALKEALSHGQFLLSDGTKGSKPRVVLVTSDRQFQTLRDAATLVGKDRNFVDDLGKWTKLEQGPIRSARELLQEQGIAKFHDHRAAFACELYKKITGVDAPVISGRVVDRALDHEARVQISIALGHGRPDHERTDILVAYVGSSK